MMLIKTVLCALLLLAMACTEATVYHHQATSDAPVSGEKPTVAAEIIEQNTTFHDKGNVRKVIDGDTLILEDGEKIRLIGINTPEVKSRYSQSQPGGEAARDWLRAKLRDAVVWLEYDAEQFDRYDRRLAHVFLESGEYLNALLLEQGLAMLTLIPPNLRYADHLIQAQRSAERQKIGIWQLPAYQRRHLSSFNAADSNTGWQRWEVTASGISESRKYSNLLVSDAFLISIPKARLHLFSPLESYLNRPLEVRGWFRKQGDQQRLYVQHPSALITLPD